MKFKHLAFYAVVAVVLIGGQFLVTRNLVSGAPPFIATATLDGKNIVEQLSKGPTLIYFWAEWCGICQVMQSSVDAVLHEYPGVTIALDSGNAAVVLDYLHKQGLAWPVVADTNGKIAARYGVTGVPAAFIVDAKGQIRFTSIGYSSAAGLRMRLWLAGWWR